MYFISYNRKGEISRVKVEGFGGKRIFFGHGYMSGCLLMEFRGLDGIAENCLLLNRNCC